MAELVDARNYVDPVDFEKQMKYGIQIVYDNGSTRYAYAAKGGHLSQTDDITDIALFVQKDSAIKALKAARKNGYEVEGSQLQVVGISLVVSEVTEVVKPPQKAGFVLAGLDKDGDETFYGDPRTKAVDRPTWTNFERATIFRSDIEAQLKLQDIRDYHQSQITRRTAKHAEISAKYDAQELRKAATRQHYSHWDSISKWQVERAFEDIEREQNSLNALDNVKIEFTQ